MPRGPRACVRRWRGARQRAAHGRGLALQRMWFAVYRTIPPYSRSRRTATKRPAVGAAVRCPGRWRGSSGLVRETLRVLTSDFLYLVNQPDTPFILTCAPIKFSLALQELPCP